MQVSLKNHKQRQQGIKLENNLESILKAKNQGFKLVQDYLEDPFIISGRKINIRYYLLVYVIKNISLVIFIKMDLCIIPLNFIKQVP